MGGLAAGPFPLHSESLPIRPPGSSWAILAAVSCDFGVQNEAQHHAPVFSKATRARRTGFYHRVGAPIAPRLWPLCFAPPDALSPPSP